MRWLLVISLLILGCTSAKQNTEVENDHHITELLEVVFEGKSTVLIQSIDTPLYRYNKSMVFTNVMMPDGSYAKTEEEFLLALDTAFSKSDRKYMLKQLASQPRQWQQNYLPTYVKLDTTGYYETIRGYYKGKNRTVEDIKKYTSARDSFNILHGFDDFYWNYYTLGYPVFNKAKDKALIKISHSCGMLCGEGGIILYYKIEGHWKRINHFQYFVS